jgi:hypothetical protein
MALNGGAYDAQRRLDGRREGPAVIGMEKLSPIFIG